MADLGLVVFQLASLGSISLVLASLRYGRRAFGATAAAMGMGAVGMALSFCAFNTDGLPVLAVPL